MAGNPVAPSGEKPAPQRRPKIADRPLDGFFQARAQREVRGDRGRERTAGPVSRAGFDPTVLEDAEASAVPEEVADPVPGVVPPLDEHRAGAEPGNALRCLAAVDVRSDLHPGERRRLGQVGRDEVAAGKEHPTEVSHSGKSEERRPPSGLEHRIENDVSRAVSPES